MTTALVCIGLLGLLLFGLGLAVSLFRGRTQTLIGHSIDPTDTLHKLVRAHANTAEYVGVLAVLIWLAGSRSPSTWGSICIIGATLSRYLLAAGIVFGATLDKPHPLRFLGALFTYVFGIAMSLSLIQSLF